MELRGMQKEKKRQRKTQEKYNKGKNEGDETKTRRDDDATMGERLTAFLALQTQSDFLGNLGLLVEDGLGLMMEY